jgi:hypothetical protein
MLSNYILYSNKSNEKSAGQALKKFYDRFGLKHTAKSSSSQIIRDRKTTLLPLALVKGDFDPET